ncbi:MAG: hypothetical protein ACREL7_15795 [Longimicrobiales bacterium]
MGVTSHLHIALDEYDARIRTFVSDHETMLEVTARALTLVEATTPTVVRLGTGALAAACLRIRPDARPVLAAFRRRSA